MFVGFEVLTAVVVTLTVFWDVTPYNLAHIYLLFFFRGMCVASIRHQCGLRVPDLSLLERQLVTSKGQFILPDYTVS